MLSQTPPSPVQFSFNQTEEPLRAARRELAQIAGHGCFAPDVMSFIQKAIGKAQEHAALEEDPRLLRAIAHLWAAADTLESLNT